MGFRLFVVHRLNYYFSKRFFIDLNAPLFIDIAETLIQKYNNPTIPVNQRKSITAGILKKDPYFNIRIGLGLKL